MKHRRPRWLSCGWGRHERGVATTWRMKCAAVRKVSIFDRPPMPLRDFILWAVRMYVPMKDAILDDIKVRGEHESNADT